MEGIAIGIAKKALDSVVSTAKTAITDEIGLLFGVQEELFFIKEELEMMQAFLRVASDEEAKGEIVTTWVRQVQELSYDVEDCLQEASVHLTKRGCVNGMLSSKARDGIARRIKVLKVRIEDVSKRNLRYGLIKSSTKNVHLDFMDKPMPGLTANDKAMIVGQSIPKRKVLGLIFEDPNKYKVISVVGMGGCGKTTLVKNVLESPELINKFLCLAWITIVHPFIEKEFIISLASELSLDQDEERHEPKVKGICAGGFNERGKWSNMEVLKDRIYEHMTREKYAIVLDNLACETEWKMIRRIFPNVAGSRLLVTTRSDDLAKSISTEHDIYRLPELSIEESLELFYKAVYKNSDYILVTDGKSNRKLRKSRSFSLSTTKEGEQPDKNFQLQKSFVYSDLQQEITPPKQTSVDLLVTEEMQIQANTIIERCGKLPVAIVAIGSFLATRPKTSDEWHKMHEHISSEIHNNPHLGSIMSSLTTSYDGLPYHLKSCYLYLCVFHNHHKIRRSRIIRRWIAEGFIMQSRDMIAEEVGEQYFNDLMGRNLIQPSEPITIGNVTQCSIHDLLYEMIVGKSENENVVSFVGDQSQMIISGKARHVVIQGGLVQKNCAFGNTNLSNIRSVTGFGKIGSYVTYHKMRLLRVLDLEGTLGLKNRDIRKIGKLRHLKYLGLRGTTITKLPGSLENLYDLETLDIRDTWVLDLPRGIMKLQKLSYLRAGFDAHKNKKLFNSYQGSKFLKNLIHTHAVSLNILCCLPILVGFCCDPTATYEVVKDVRFCKCICGNYLVEATDGPGILTNFGSFGLKAPPGMSKMRSLHKFGTVDIGQSMASAKELKYLRNLTKIAIVGFSEKNGKVLGEAIGELINLKSLVLAASDRLGLGCCLSSIKTPPKFLQSLKLFSPIDKLPEWFSSLDNLVKLYFRDTGLPVVEIKKMENLKALKEVVLDDRNVDVVKSVMDMNLRNPNKPEVRCLNTTTEIEESV